MLKGSFRLYPHPTHIRTNWCHRHQPFKAARSLLKTKTKGTHKTECVCNNESTNLYDIFLFIQSVTFFICKEVSHLMKMLRANIRIVKLKWLIRSMKMCIRWMFINNIQHQRIIHVYGLAAEGWLVWWFVALAHENTTERERKMWFIRFNGSSVGTDDEHCFLWWQNVYTVAKLKWRWQ